MGDTTSASEHEERKLKLEEREADRADRQLELDNRWVKVWGPALITGILALAGVVITGLITWTENRFSDQEKAIEDNRAAAEMYFDKLGDLENKDKLTDTEKKRLINDLQIISILGHDQRFNTIFITEQKVVYASMLGDAYQTGVAPTKSEGQAPEAGPASEIPSSPLSGLPSVGVAGTNGSSYSPDVFLAFPQVPGSSDPYEKRFVSALVSLGFNVQPTQHMAPGKSPSDNEIRYYLADQAKFAGQIATQLKQQTGLTFDAVQLHTPGLPNGVMEFWLGTNSAK